MIDSEFEAGARDGWQQPQRVVEALGLEGWETVIDVGAGIGYFARHLSRRARLIAVDPVYCDHLRRSGYEAYQRIDQIDEADLVFAANVLRFLGGDEIARIAELTSRIVLLDWKPGPRAVGPPASEEVSIEEAVRAFPGFRAGPTQDFLPYQWMIELRKK